MKHAVLVLAACVFAAVASLFGQVPQKMSYQGLLTTSLGTPVPEGNYSIKFDIYNLPTTGTLRHTETHPAVAVVRGAFSVLLGPLPAIFTESLYVEVTALSGPGILTPTTFSPRSELASAPYALAPWATSGGSIYYNPPDSRVGIGTSTPTAPLHVRTSLGPALDGAATIENSGTDGNALVARANNGTSAWAIWGQAYGGGFAGRFDGRGYFSDNLGIGVTSPTEKLDVAGNIKLSGALMPNNSAGTLGQLLTSAGAGTPPTWTNPTVGAHTHDAGDISTGILAIARGGTSNSSVAANGAVAYSDGLRYGFTASVGTNGQFLKSNGGGAPSWSAVDLSDPNQVTGTLDVTDGGTAATDPNNARLNLGAAARGSNSDITSINGLTTPLAVNQGGTGAANVSAARFNLGAAASGANSDITSLNGLVTPLGINQGGTGAQTANNARTNLGAAARGNNSDITSITGLATPLAVNQGGTGNGAAGVSGSIIYYAGTGYNYTTAGASNQHLKSSGGGAPTWGSVNLGSTAEVSGTLPVSNGGTGSSFQNFVDLTSVQTANGNKTFGGNTTFQGTVTIGAGMAPGAPIFDVWSATGNLAFPPTAPGTNTDLFVVVNGAQLGDVVMLGVPNGSVLPNSAFTAWVSAPNQVTVRFNNYSAGALMPPMGLFRVAVMRF